MNLVESYATFIFIDGGRCVEFRNSPRTPVRPRLPAASRTPMKTARSLLGHWRQCFAPPVRRSRHPRPDETAVLFDDHALELMSCVQVGIGRNVETMKYFGLRRPKVGRDRRRTSFGDTAPGHLDGRATAASRRFARPESADATPSTVDSTAARRASDSPISPTPRAPAGEAEIHHGGGLTGGLGHDRIIDPSNRYLTDHLGEDLAAPGWIGSADEHLDVLVPSTDDEVM